MLGSASTGRSYINRSLSILKAALASLLSPMIPSLLLATMSVAKEALRGYQFGGEGADGRAHAEENHLCLRERNSKTCKQ